MNMKLKLDTLFQWYLRASYGLIYFSLLMSNMHLILMKPSGYKVIQNVILSVGAGIYEEVLFRVV